MCNDVYIVCCMRACVCNYHTCLFLCSVYVCTRMSVALSDVCVCARACTYVCISYKKVEK